MPPVAGTGHRDWLSMTLKTESLSFLLAGAGRSRRAAIDNLIPVLYQELHRIASGYLRRERSNHTLQPTALVNEAYLRLTAQLDVEWESRTHFLAIAANIMRRVLVDHARARSTEKRGGGQTASPLDETIIVSFERDVDLVALDEALDRLADMDRRLAEIVEMKYFGGLTTAEIAVLVGISTASVDREWATARSWLKRELGKGVAK